MIRALQRRVEEKEVLYQKALMRTTLSSGKRLVFTLCSLKEDNLDLLPIREEALGQVEVIPTLFMSKPYSLYKSVA